MTSLIETSLRRRSARDEVHHQSAPEMAGRLHQNAPEVGEAASLRRCPWLGPFLPCFGPCPLFCFRFCSPRVARHPIYHIPLMELDSQWELSWSHLGELGAAPAVWVTPQPGKCILESLKPLSPPFLDSPELGIQVGTPPSGRSGWRDITRQLQECGEIRIRWVPNGSCP